MQTNQDNLQDLRKCTVAIQRSSDGKVVSTGIIVTTNGIILTCYHVVGDIKNKILDEMVDIYFSSMPEVKRNAQPIEQYCDPKLDIAFLKLQEQKLPEQAAIANLSETIEDGHTFKSFGFRRYQSFDGLNSYGRIDGKVRKRLKDNSLSPGIIQLYSDGIDHGMSGAAVLDTQINRVIGVVSEYLATSSNVDKNFALAIPIESIIKSYAVSKNFVKLPENVRNELQKRLVKHGYGYNIH